MQLDPEETADDVRADVTPPIAIEADDWPRTGSVEFRNVTIRYDPDGPDILKDVNLRLEAGERVAVVGRTGSGKSTASLTNPILHGPQKQSTDRSKQLVLSMLHFTNVVSGTILYDGVDITLVPRKRLRRAITIIPQEAVLFHGTVGSNLDPSGEVPVERLQDAISACGNIASFNFRDDAAGADPEAAVDDDTIGAAQAVVFPGIDTHPTEATPLLLSSTDAVAATTTSTAASTATPPANPVVSGSNPPPPAGLSLSAPVLPHGSNFSHGQRQVLSLCRALVRRSRLMLLDEATASMDYETDRGIQAVLRREMGVSSSPLPLGDGHGAGSGAGSGEQGEQGEGGEKGKRTLVTIAHRLRTIVDYDKVVVMGGGRVLEVGTPGELYKRGGTFWEMVGSSGEGGELERLMEE